LKIDCLSNTKKMRIHKKVCNELIKGSLKLYMQYIRMHH
jgi:hypothetical protein